MDLSPLIRYLPSILSLMGGSLFVFIAYAQVVSAESVRVLVAQDVALLEISSDGGVEVETEEGKTKVVRSPIHVSSSKDGLQVNGRRTLGEHMLIRPLKHHLLLIATQMAGMESDARLRSTREGHIAVTQGPLLSVSGMVRVLRKGQKLSVVNQVDLEEYVKGVVPSEVSAAWHPEMLRVQAVAARTYALYNKMLSAAREFDVMSTIQDQVYRGRSGVDHRVEEAVESTRGVVVTHLQAPIYAAFSSTAAGPTEDAVNVWANKDLPYLKGVECPFDIESPYYQWKVNVKMDHLEQNLRRQGFSVGTIATMTPIAYSRAGRVARLRILHSGGETILRGEDLRKAAGYTVIPSTQFEVQSIGSEVVFTGYGAGHAVGLCQWGAKELAELGYSYPSILQYYYPGTELRNTAASKLMTPATPSP